jgi:hypothetical protein
MKCDFQASLLTRIFGSPCLAHELKARITTIIVALMNDYKVNIHED